MDEVWVYIYHGFKERPVCSRFMVLGNYCMNSPELIICNHNALPHLWSRKSSTIKGEVTALIMSFSCKRESIESAADKLHMEILVPVILIHSSTGFSLFAVFTLCGESYLSMDNVSFH